MYHIKFEFIYLKLVAFDRKNIPSVEETGTLEINQQIE